MRTLGLLVGVCLMAAPLAAQREPKVPVSVPSATQWTPTNTVLLTTSSALLLADWSMSLYGRQHSSTFYEKNPFIGPRPSERSLNLYFGAALVGNYVMARTLRNPWRNVFLGLVTLVEGRVVWNNWTLGVRMALP